MFVKVPSQRARWQSKTIKKVVKTRFQLTGHFENGCGRFAKFLFFKGLNAQSAACRAPYNIKFINYLFINTLSLHKYKDIQVYRHSGTRHFDL